MYQNITRQRFVKTRVNIVDMIAQVKKIDFLQPNEQKNLPERQELWCFVSWDRTGWLMLIESSRLGIFWKFQGIESFQDFFSFYKIFFFFCWSRNRNIKMQCTFYYLEIEFLKKKECGCTKSKNMFLMN